MTRECRAPGCRTHAMSRYAAYCSTHKGRLRRHGDVSQEAITKADLSTYQERVRRRVESNRDNPVWGQLNARWVALRGHAESVLAHFRSGKPGARHEFIASKEVMKLMGSVEPREVVATALAMFLMLEDQPRRFRSDRAFRTQLVRRVRGLAELNVGTWIDRATGKPKRAYVELTPRAAAVLGQWFAEAFGAAGVHLAKLDRRDGEAKRREIEGLHEALQQLR